MIFQTDHNKFRQEDVSRWLAQHYTENFQNLPYTLYRDRITHEILFTSKGESTGPASVAKNNNQNKLVKCFTNGGRSTLDFVTFIDAFLNVYLPYMTPETQIIQSQDNDHGVIQGDMPPHLVSDFVREFFITPLSKQISKLYQGDSPILVITDNPALFIRLLSKIYIYEDAIFDTCSRIFTQFMREKAEQDCYIMVTNTPPIDLSPGRVQSLQQHLNLISIQTDPQIKKPRGWKTFSISSDQCVALASYFDTSPLNPLKYKKIRYFLTPAHLIIPNLDYHHYSSPCNLTELQQVTAMSRQSTIRTLIEAKWHSFRKYGPKTKQKVRLWASPFVNPNEINYYVKH